jgi:hypothetical protein
MWCIHMVKYNAVLKRKEILMLSNMDEPQGLYAK